MSTTTPNDAALPPPIPGTMHRYSPTKKLFAFEHQPPHPPTSPQTQNTLLFVGGLSDGLLTVSYTPRLAAALPPGWSFAEIQLTSSYQGWGTGSLRRDAAELAEAVGYFARLRPAGRVVLMGNSTGCQDVLWYLTQEDGEGRPPVAGALLQASVSDREAFQTGFPLEVYARWVRTAEEWIAAGKGEDVLPLDNPFEDLVCARRFWSLASPGGEGEDDFFSSDFDERRLREKGFARVPRGTRVAFLMSGADEYVPETVDKRALVKRWARVVREGGAEVDERNGGVVEGASHSLSGDPEEVVGDLVQRVTGFLRGLEG